MSLAGSVESFPLRAVISLLESTAARGVLHLDGAAGPTELHVDGGALVGWTPAGDTDPVEVVAHVLEAPDTCFRWDDGAQPELRCVPVALGELTSGAERRAGEWAEMRAVAPTRLHRATLLASGAAGPVVLDPVEWQIACAIGGDGATLDELSTRLGSPALDLHRAVGAMRDRGLVAIVAPHGRDATVATSAPKAEPAPPSCAAGSGAGGSGASASTLPPLPSRPGSSRRASKSPDRGVVDEALGDRGPWPAEQLRALVDEADGDGTVPAGPRRAPAHAAAGAIAPPVPGDTRARRPAERGTLMRFFASAKA